MAKKVFIKQQAKQNVKEIKDTNDNNFSVLRSSQNQ